MVSSTEYLHLLSLLIAFTPGLPGLHQLDVQLRLIRRDRWSSARAFGIFSRAPLAIAGGAVGLAHAAGPISLTGGAARSTAMARRKSEMN